MFHIIATVITPSGAKGPNPWAQGHLYTREATAKAVASQLNVSAK